MHILTFSAFLNEHRLFHGSPYSFDAFSTDFIKKGEGIQAEGWGIYLTSSRDKAISYTTANVIPTEFTIHPHIAGVDLSPAQVAILSEVILDAAKSKYNITGSRVDNSLILNRLERRDDNQSRELYDLLYEEGYDILHHLKRVGKVYDVEIPDDATWFMYNEVLPTDLLTTVLHRLGQLPAGATNPAKGEYLMRMLRFPKPDYPKGMHLYGCLSDYLNGEKNASLFLYDMGFTGTYYTLGSTVCYLMYNANDISIVAVENIDG